MPFGEKYEGQTRQGRESVYVCGRVGYTDRIQKEHGYKGSLKMKRKKKREKDIKKGEMMSNAESEREIEIERG